MAINWRRKEHAKRRIYSALALPVGSIQIRNSKPNAIARLGRARSHCRRRLKLEIMTDNYHVSGRLLKVPLTVTKIIFALWEVERTHQHCFTTRSITIYLEGHSRETEALVGRRKICGLDVHSMYVCRGTKAPLLFPHHSYNRFWQNSERPRRVASRHH